MTKQNSNNQDFTNEADGFTLGGGSTKRKLKVTGSDVTLTGSNSVTLTLPSSSTSLLGASAIDTDDTLAANSDDKVASQKATKTYVDTKDNQNVKLTGTQTIAGDKTFTGSTKVQSAMLVDSGLGGAFFSGYLGGFLQLTKTSGDSKPALQLFAGNSSIQLGSGGSTSPDITIKRTGVNQLDFGSAKLQSVADPVNDQDVATKKYVDDSGGGASLPEQAGNSGKYLTTDGTDASWGAIGTLSSPRVNTLTASGSTYTIDTDTTDIAIISSPTADFTVAASGTPADGQKVMLRLANGATAYAPTWDSIFISSGLAVLPTSYPASKTNLHGFMYDANKSKWVLIALDSIGY